MCVFAAIPQAGDAYSMVGRTIILYICSLLSSDNRLRRFIIGYRCFMTAMPLFLALVMCDLKVSPLSRMTPRYFASDFHSMSSLNMRSGGGYVPAKCSPLFYHLSGERRLAIGRRSTTVGGAEIGYKSTPNTAKNSQIVHQFELSTRCNNIKRSETVENRSLHLVYRQVTCSNCAFSASRKIFSTDLLFLKQTCFFQSSDRYS